MSNYSCYGCKIVFVGTDDLAFICNCFHEGFPKYRGVCRQCVVNGEQIYIPQKHSLSKIHVRQNGAPPGDCLCCSSFKDLASIPKNIRHEPK